MNAPHGPRNPYLRKLLRDPLILPFYLPAFLLFLGYGLTLPVLPLYARSFGVSYAWVGAVMSAQSLGMLISDLPSGLLLRRLGQKRAMLLGMGVMVLGQVALFWAGSVQMAFVYRLCAGFGVALYGVARHAYVAERTEVQGRGRAMALFGGLLRTGKFLGPLMGGALAAAHGLRVPFLAMGGISSLGVLSVALFLRPAGRPASAPIRATGQLRALGTVFQRTWRVLTPAGLGQIFAGIIRSGRDTVVTLYAADVVGLDVNAIGLLMGIAAAAETAMFLPGGWTMDNLGRKYVLVPGFAAQAVAMACVPLTGSFGGLLACAMLAGMGNGLTSGSMMTLGADLAPPDARSEFLSLWRLIGDVGGTSGPSIGGFVADSFALPAAALTLAGAALVASSIFGLLLPETLHRTQDG